jgi:hypothetical protein
MNHKHNALVCFGFMIALTILIPQVIASSQPTITIPSNPVSYGQNDKISATAASLYDSMLLYLNNTLVAGPAKTNVNYTVCGNGVCPIPGTYIVTAYDNTTGASTIENLMIAPVAPSFSVQYSNPTYGDIDTITADPAFYNDYMAIEIDGSQMDSSSPGVFVYSICGNVSNGEPCLSAGTHNITVLDSTEGVSAGSNETIVVKPVPPTVSIQNPVVQYGDSDNLVAVAPLQTDQIGLFLNSSQIASGTGNMTYTICNYTANQQTCRAPSTYFVYAVDYSEGVNSSIKQLTVTPLPAPTISVFSSQVAYGVSDRISASAVNPNVNVSIYIDGTQFASGTGKVTYTICGVIVNDSCIPAGVYNVSSYDSAENLSSPNITINITAVLPSISVSYLDINSGMPDKIYGTAPFYNDTLSAVINGARIANGTGTVTYVICGSAGSPSCLSPGVYNVSIDDVSEGVSTTPETIDILSPQNASGQSTSSILYTTVSPNGSNVATTITNTTPPSSKVPSVQGMNYLEVIAGIIIVIMAILVAVLLHRRNRRPIEISPSPPSE